MPGASGSPAPKMRTSADRSQPERKELACKAVAQPHLPMALLAQRQKRMGLLACLATSNFIRIFRGPCRSSPAALLPKCECLQIARSQKELACKAVAQPHLPMALLAQAQRLGLPACLAISNVKRSFGGSMLGSSGCPAPKMRTSADSSHP